MLKMAQDEANNEPPLNRSLVLPDEAELIESAKLGDTEAFAVLYKRYQSFIHWFIYNRVGSIETAQDLLQETLLKAWIKLPEANDETKDKFKSWLMKIALRVVLNYVKHEGSRGKNIALEDCKEDELHRFESIIRPEDQAIQNECMIKAFARLSARQQDILYWYVWMGYSPNEIATKLSVNVGTVGQFIRRTRLKFCEEYERIEGSKSLY